jgi:hypothetical protein
MAVDGSRRSSTLTASTMIPNEWVTTASFGIWRTDHPRRHPAETSSCTRQSPIPTPEAWATYLEARSVAGTGLLTGGRGLGAAFRRPYPLSRENGVEKASDPTPPNGSTT